MNGVLLLSRIIFFFQVLYDYQFSVNDNEVLQVWILIMESVYINLGRYMYSVYNEYSVDVYIFID